MDRETRRQIEEYRRTEAGPLENNLIDELVDGELDRQEFLARATMFGLSVGDDGRAARATSVRQDAARRPRRRRVKAGGTIRVGITAFGGSLEPYLLNEGGSLAFAGIPGEYLTFTNPQGRVVPCARDELEAERQRDGLDVPDPEGRQVPQRQDDDREGRRREHEAVRRAQRARTPA